MKLGIIEYKDYVYNLSNSSQYLKSLFQYDPVFESKVSSAVLTDIIQQNTKVLVELSEEVVKRLFRLTLPLAVSTFILGGVLVVENSKLLSQVFTLS